jgi:hypothetical protein
MRAMMSPNNHKTTTTTPPLSPSYDTNAVANGGGPISPSLIDRLAFVLVDCNNNTTPTTPTTTTTSPRHASFSSLSQQQQQQIWWPAWMFESASEMFHVLSLTTPHRAALMQEFFEVGRHQPTLAQQHVAYLLGGGGSDSGKMVMIPGSRRTVYASPTRDFWTISDEVITKCSEYPGWCDACLAAPEWSNCNLEGTTATTTMTTTGRVTSPLHRNNNNNGRSTSVSPLRNTRSYVSPSNSPVRSRRAFEYDYEEEEEDDEEDEDDDDRMGITTSPTMRRSSSTSPTAAAAGSAVKYRRRRNFN